VGWLPAVATAATTTAATAAAAAATTATAAIATAAAAEATTATAAVATAAEAATTAAEATAATTTAEAAATAAATEAAATAAASTITLALLGLVHTERTALERLAIHTLDRARSLLRRRHGHERKAPRAARLAVGHEVDVLNGAELLEDGAHGLGAGVEGQVAHVQSVVHRNHSLSQPTSSRMYLK
jgi:hypothetical protein